MRIDPAATTLARYAAVLDGACTARDARACVRLGQVVELDKTRSQQAYERGCALGDAPACMSVIGLDAGWEAKAAVLRHRLEPRCAERDGRSCMVLGLFALLIDHDADAKRVLDGQAADAFEASCRAGTVDDCVVAAQQIDQLNAADKDRRIRPLLDRGCQLGDGAACLLVASNVSDLGTAERATLRERAFDRGIAAACVQIAADAIKRDAAAGTKLLTHGIAVGEGACGLGDDQACILLASLVGSDLISDAEARRLATTSERACDQHQILTCVRLAEVLADGPAARRDEARAQSLRDRACKLGYPFTCPGGVLPATPTRRETP